MEAGANGKKVAFVTMERNVRRDNRCASDIQRSVRNVEGDIYCAGEMQSSVCDNWRVGEMEKGDFVDEIGSCKGKSGTQSLKKRKCASHARIRMEKSGLVGDIESNGQRNATQSSKKRKGAVHDRIEGKMKWIEQRKKVWKGKVNVTYDEHCKTGRDVQANYVVSRDAVFTPSRRLTYESDEVGNLLKAFEERRKKCFLNGEFRPDLRAMKELDDYKRGRIKGSNIPGVHVNDCFEFRSEISIIGLHCLHIGGIDFVYCNNLECDIAVSIVDSGGYNANRVENNYQVLIYSGEGGKRTRKSCGKHIEDQKLTGDNLALSNCLKHSTSVRVIRAHKVELVESVSKKIYCYYGMYKVVKREVSLHGPIIYKFRLERDDDQPPLLVPRFSIPKFGNRNA